MRALPAILLLAVAALATPAIADPCKAIPDKGPAPGWLRPGATVSGTVVYVGDGDSLCVAARGRSDPLGGDSPGRFLRSRTSRAGRRGGKGDAATPDPRRTAHLPRGPQTYDRVAATCRLGGRNLADQMRAAGVAEGGRGQ
jgi:endonuclease YncB( thermonuclease family)